MIYEDDVKKRVCESNGLLQVFGEVKFEGSTKRSTIGRNKEDLKKLTKKIRKDQIKGLGDLFYSEARKALFELQLNTIKATMEQYEGTEDLEVELEKKLQVIRLGFAKVSDFLKIQPGKCAAPKMATAPNGEKVVTNGRG